MSLDIDFGLPVSFSKFTVTSGWGRPRPGGRIHPGIDIPLREGTPLLALQSGEVIRSDTVADSDAGIWVGIKHVKGWVSRYMHLSRVAVAKGQHVRKGQVIGYSGNTGLSSGPHLHLDLKMAPANIPQLKREVGEPKTGFLNDAGYGVGVPAEPWVPFTVEQLSIRTIAEAKANGIPLYYERERFFSTGSNVIALGLGVGLGAVLWLLR